LWRGYNDVLKGLPNLQVNLEALAHKVGYVCIFSRTTDDAIANLHRLITTGDCGFDEGTEFWRKALEDISAGYVNSLNWAGAKFSESEWRVILENTRMRL
jgi:hypothetical protein